MLSKVIFLFLSWTLMQVLAGEYDWYPADPVAIAKKCEEENPLSRRTMAELLNGYINDNPDVRGFMMCTAKGLNYYSTEKGFDVDRVAYNMFTNSTLPCHRECVTKHNSTQPEGAMIFGVHKCLRNLELKASECVKKEH